MDLGVRIQGSVSGNENGSPGQTELGSGFGNKQERSGFESEDSWRSSKLSRTSTDGFSSSSAAAKTLSFHQGVPLLRSTSIDPRRQEHMLSFSSASKSNKSDVSPYRNSGYCLGGMMNTSSMHGSLLTGVKGPFSLTQWAELEQQALIYEYITANVPVPSSLLLSLKKSFFPYGSLPPNSFGWGSFHLGFSSGNMDPEPGRCRRTDGKKWRCSRDAVPDQKYCERHINRGRHRSRKPVEGLNGHNNTNAAATSAASKAAAATTTVVAMPGSDNNNTMAAIETNHHANVSMANRIQNAQAASVFPATMNLQAKESHLKQSSNPFEFGLISSESLLNPSHKQPSYANSSKGFGSYLDFSNQEKNSNVDSWTEELKSDWTQLSMSIPMAPSSPVQDKLALSPLRLSREFDPAIRMGLGLNTEFLEPAKKANNWIPISWGNNNSMGGPLGEVLNSTTNSPKFGSSPTGVLQRSTFGSLSNSSSGSSSVLGDNSNKNCDGKDPLGLTTMMHSSASAPSL